MSKWREVRLGEVLNLSNGKSIKQYKDGSYPVYGSNGIIGKNTQYNFKEAMVIGRVGAYCGSIHLEIDPFWASDNTIIAEIKNNDDLVFLYFYFKLVNLNLFAGGSAQPLLTQNVLKNIKIKIPDLETQEKIAQVLSSYDELIENNNRRIELLENMAEEIYKEWFVRMRFPGHEEVRFEKGIPEGWELKKIGDIAKFKRGKNLRIADAIEGSVPVIAGGIEPSCYHNEANTSAPVITVSASGANAGYTKLNYIDVWASDCSYIDRNDTNLIYYIYLLMKVSSNEILNLQTGSAQPHVYAKDINNFKFLKPNEWLIDKINNLSKEIFDEISLLNKQNQNLIKQRDMLLPRLMNGTIEVK